MFVEGEGAVYALPHQEGHSPDGFSWGNLDAGAADLARCILLDFDGDDSDYQLFKEQVIAKLPAQWPFVLRGDFIAGWRVAQRSV